MIIFSWQPEMALGITLIDEQHKDLLKAANNFFISFKCQNCSNQAQKCLDFFSLYILYHFQVEESFMEASGYPNYREHQAIHRYLAMQFKLHATNLIASDFSQERLNAFHDFVYDWILNHIFKEDKAFASYYNEKSI